MTTAGTFVPRQGQNAILIKVTCISLFFACLAVSSFDRVDAQDGQPQCCDPRVTLMQWSYGTGFGGGASRDEPLVTDRPDFTEASTTVGWGVVQLETGYTYIYDNDGTTQTINHSVPETLLRVGILADWFELRLGWNYLQESTRPGRTLNGSDDLVIGAKLALTPQEAILPEMALIPQMVVPVGSAAFTGNDVRPGVIWIYGWEINDCVSTAGQSQINQQLDPMTNRVYYEFSQSWTVAYSLTEQLGAYTEWFCLIPDGADTAMTEHYFNGGFTYLVSNNIQLDVRAGKGLSSASDDYFVGLGASVRFY